MIQVLAASAWSLQRAIDILDNGDYILSDKDARESSQMILLHIKSYVWLSADCFVKHQLLFRLRPKHHYMVHQAWQISEQRLNISRFSTFDEESFLGRVKRIVTACHGATCYTRFYQRYILVLAMMLRKHRQFSRSL